MTSPWKLRIGTAFGIPLYLHLTFFLLPLLILWASPEIGTAGQAAYLFGLVFAVFGCVVLHELGHALTARRFGIRTRDITLYPIGGVARLERMSERPWEEFWIAVAGPAVNVVIALALGAVLLAGAVAAGEEGLGVPGQFLFNLLISNLVLVGFNLIPAFPMDGGRVLPAVLSPRIGRGGATEIAARLGVGFAVLFMAGG